MFPFLICAKKKAHCFDSCENWLSFRTVQSYTQERRWIIVVMQYAEQSWLALKARSIDGVDTVSSFLILAMEICQFAAWESNFHPRLQHPA